MGRPQHAARGQGRILNLSSVVASQPVPQLAFYAATKAFVSSLSMALSKEMRPHGVTVTTLHPGATGTEFAAEAGLDRTVALRLFGTISPPAWRARVWMAWPPAASACCPASSPS